jgi:hypothetical protein
MQKPEHSELCGAKKPTPTICCFIYDASDRKTRKAKKSTISQTNRKTERINNNVVVDVNVIVTYG